MKKYGMQDNDIIVAIDGYHDDNVRQYTLVRGLNSDPKMDLILWHENGYIEVHPQVENRLFGVTIGTHRNK